MKKLSKEHHEGHIHHKKMVDHHMSEMKKHMSELHKIAKQKISDKKDESLSMKHGKESTKKQSFEDRRHESKGAKKHG